MTYVKEFKVFNGQSCTQTVGKYENNHSFCVMPLITANDDPLTLLELTEKIDIIWFKSYYLKLFAFEIFLLFELLMSSMVQSSSK